MLKNVAKIDKIIYTKNRNAGSSIFFTGKMNGYSFIEEEWRKGKFS